jgi:hypothetical protein
METFKLKLPCTRYSQGCPFWHGHGLRLAHEKVQSETAAPVISHRHFKKYRDIICFDVTSKGRSGVSELWETAALAVRSQCSIPDRRRPAASPTRERRRSASDDARI